MKKCTKCKNFLDESQFSKNRSHKDGLQNNCKSCSNANRRDWATRNPDKMKSYFESWFLNNVNRKRAMDKVWRDNNFDRRRSYNRYWQYRNRHIVNAISAKRRAELALRAPPWLSMEQVCEIKSLYERARRITTELGTKHEVDHIVPLQGKYVCGLHVPWNLQVISASANRSKGNSFG